MGAGYKSGSKVQMGLGWSRVQMDAGYKSGSRVQMGLGWSRVQMGLELCRVQMGVGAGSRFWLV